MNVFQYSFDSCSIRNKPLHTEVECVLEKVRASQDSEGWWQTTGSILVEMLDHLEKDSSLHIELVDTDWETQKQDLKL